MISDNVTHAVMVAGEGGGKGVAGGAVFRINSEPSQKCIL